MAASSRILCLLVCGGFMPDTRFVVVYLATLTIGVFASTFGPSDATTWFLEVCPVMAGIVVVAATFQRFPLSRLLYLLLFGHAVILMVGGFYTYAEVPAGFWVRDIFDLDRNHYDRLGHFAQGFVPAILAREILVRRSPLRHSRWLPVLVVSVCLSFSAFYELIEWWAALAIGQSAAHFLGTQGDSWDTQWDMFLALVGAIVALLTLTRLHDRSMAALAD
jgi:putative membrane protein